MQDDPAAGSSTVCNQKSTDDAYIEDGNVGSQDASAEDSGVSIVQNRDETGPEKNAQIE